MAAKNPSWFNFKSPLVLGGVALLVIALGWGFFSYQNYAQGSANSPGGAPISVFIQNPQPGSQFEIGAPVAVYAQASGPSPVISMELWVDGEMAQMLSAPSPEGLLEFQANYYLNNLALGGHSIFVRAIGASYETKTSADLPIEVVEIGQVTLEEGAAAYVDPGPSVPAAILAQNAGGGGAPYFGEPADEGEPDSPPNFPNPEEPPAPHEPLDLNIDLLPAETWSPNLSDWFNFIFPNNQGGLPAAPGIPASEVVACRPAIWISDNSLNEHGFYVYRRDPGLANFLKIATLEPPSYFPVSEDYVIHFVSEDEPYKGPVFGFEDEEVYGSYQYYVSSFNSSGESAASNIETVEVDSEECKLAITSTFAFNLASLFVDQGSEMSYCYYTLDGMNWLRHPAAAQSFMNTSDADPDFDQLLLNDPGQATPLSLDCWAWLGGDLTQIGTWQFANIFANGFEGIEFEKVDYGGDSIFALGALGNQFFYNLLPYDPRVPIPIVSLGSGNQVCGDHTGGNFILVLVCADIADDLDYASWDLGECFLDLCFKESNIVGYNVYDSLHNDGLTPVDTIDDPISLYFMINGQSCDPRHIRVSALVEYEGQLLESFPSNSVFYNGNPNCPFLFGLEPRTYRITLDTIDFSAGNIDDGADAEDDFELYGHVVLRTENYSGHSWNMPKVPCSSCSPIREIHEVDDDVEDNPYLWADFFLYSCKHDSPLCYEGVLNLNPILGYNNNTGDFELYQGESAWIDILLADEDDDLDDAACEQIGAFVFSTYDVDSAPNQTLFIEFSQFDGDEDCVVRAHVELLP